MLYGSIVDSSFVQGLPQYENVKSIGAKQLSDVAWSKMTDAEGETFKTTNSMKEEYGNGVSTLINIYNASGSELRQSRSGNSSGHVWKYAWDTAIQNGQWSGVLHVHPSGSARGSVGYIVYEYRGDRALAIAWSNPYSGSNKAYCEVLTLPDAAGRPDSSFYDSADRGSASGSTELDGFQVLWNLGQDTSPLFTVSIHIP